MKVSSSILCVFYSLCLDFHSAVSFLPCPISHPSRRIARLIPCILQPTSTQSPCSNRQPSCWCSWPTPAAAPLNISQLCVPCCEPHILLMMSGVRGAEAEAVGEDDSRHIAAGGAAAAGRWQHLMIGPAFAIVDRSSSARCCASIQASQSTPSRGLCTAVCRQTNAPASRWLPRATAQLLGTMQRCAAMRWTSPDGQGAAGGATATWRRHRHRRHRPVPTL